MPNNMASSLKVSLFPLISEACTYIQQGILGQGSEGQKDAYDGHPHQNTVHICHRNKGDHQLQQSKLIPLHPTLILPHTDQL